jgi:hypothetical protein
MVSSLQRPALESRGDGHRSAGKVGKVGRKTKYRMDNCHYAISIAMAGVKTPGCPYLSFNAMSCSQVVSSVLSLDMVIVSVQRLVQDLRLASV